MFNLLIGAHMRQINLNELVRDFFSNFVWNCRHNKYTTQFERSDNYNHQHLIPVDKTWIYVMCFSSISFSKRPRLSGKLFVKKQAVSILRQPLQLNTEFITIWPPILLQNSFFWLNTVFTSVVFPDDSFVWRHKLTHGFVKCSTQGWRTTQEWLNPYSNLKLGKVCISSQAVINHLLMHFSDLHITCWRPSPHHRPCVMRPYTCLWWGDVGEM